MTFETVWACLKCGATAHKHGKGECLTGGDPPYYADCEGLICDCDSPGGGDHGQTLADQCENANCYHCGWGGTLPMPKWKKGSWQDKAWKAGWRPLN